MEKAQTKPFLIVVREPYVRDTQYAPTAKVADRAESDEWLDFKNAPEAVLGIYRNQTAQKALEAASAAEGVEADGLHAYELAESASQ